MGTSRSISAPKSGAGEMPAVGPGPTVKKGNAYDVGSATQTSKTPAGMKTQKDGE